MSTQAFAERIEKRCPLRLASWVPLRGCRGNVLLLRVIYDNIIRGKTECVVTFIDFAAAFDSVSHKYLDKALRKAGASRKTRVMFRAIYTKAAGVTRVKGIDGKVTMSMTFEVRLGVV